MGIGFCDWRTVALMQTAQKLGYFTPAKRQEYMYIFVRTLELDYNDRLCSGNLADALPLFLETTANSIFVSFHSPCIDIGSYNRPASPARTHRRRWHSCGGNLV